MDANAREYVPAASAAWEKKFPGMFIDKDVWMRTDGLDGNGLGTSGQVATRPIQPPCERL